MKNLTTAYFNFFLFLQLITGLPFLRINFAFEPAGISKRLDYQPKKRYYALKTENRPQNSWHKYYQRARRYTGRKS